MIPNIDTMSPETFFQSFLNQGHITWFEKPWEQIFKEHFISGISRTMDAKTFFQGRFVLGRPITPSIDHHIRRVVMGFSVNVKKG